MRDGEKRTKREELKKGIVLYFPERYNNDNIMPSHPCGVDFPETARYYYLDWGKE